ncbi:hypothetical protein BH10BAC6_BH10BAC6_17560 [soil metagenome]
MSLQRVDVLPFRKHEELDLALSLPAAAGRLPGGCREAAGRLPGGCREAAGKEFEDRAALQLLFPRIAGTRIHDHAEESLGGT